ncbi:hypothetical protein C8R43DRAFT_354407 [Mycena crocata]|nr:hypothetical protein C8R43DRAFT_354407 [Mycena crocata]
MCLRHPIHIPSTSTPTNCATMDSSAGPSRPPSESTVSTSDILSYKNVSTAQTPGPPPGAFPDEPFFGPNDVGAILRATVEVAKFYFPTQITGYFDAVFLTVSPLNEPASLIGTPRETNLDVVDDYVPHDVPIELSPTSLKPVRPQFFIHSSSFHSHAFGPARSASSSSIYSPPVSSSPALTPGALGYTPLTASPTLLLSNSMKRVPGAIPFASIPPVAAPELISYFPAAGALSEMTEAGTPAGLVVEDDDFETEKARREALVHAETDEDAQRAVLSDPHQVQCARAHRYASASGGFLRDSVHHCR